MTSEQRNWQFMSMFLVESMRLEVVPPPDADRWYGLAAVGFNAVHSKAFRLLVDLTIVGSVVSMVGQQSLLSVDPTGLVGKVLLGLDEVALFVFTLEAIFTLGGLGARVYVREFRMEALVCGTMWTTTTLLYLKVYSGVEVFPQVQALAFIRAMRLITVLKRVHAIKKIHFLVMIAWPQVLNLCCIMVVVFIMFAAYATMLCGNVPHTSPVTEFDNFDTVRSSFRVLFQLCTGMSMFGINHECAEHNGKPVLLFFIGFFFFTNMMLVNLFIALLLDNFDLMGSEDMAVSDMDIRLFKRRWTRYAGSLHGEKRRQTIHDSISLTQVRRFVHQPGMGTFSMMPQADPFYFNRVIFELHPPDGKPGDYTMQDLMECQQGSKDIRIFFFDLLLALCHIRFSSSCLTLANEVDKSTLLVKQHESHAARIIQVGARAFCTRRSVNVYGERSAPGFIWFSESSTGENPQPMARLVKGKDYPDGPSGRCKVCTLPMPWCECNAKRKALAEQEEHRKKLEQAYASGDRQAIALLKSADVGTDGAETESWDMRGTDDDAFQEMRTKTKHTWDSAVNVAMFLTLRSLINIDRITPEHVVSDSFDKLQSLVDKRKDKRSAMAKMFSRDNDEEEVDTSQYDQGNRKRLKAFNSVDSENAPESILGELSKLSVVEHEECLRAFRKHDEYESGCVSSHGFGAALATLGAELSPGQLQTLDGILVKEQDGSIDYEDFLQTLDDGMATLEEKLADPTRDSGTQSKKNRGRKKGAKLPSSTDGPQMKFANPLVPDGDEAAQNSVDTSQSKDEMMKFVNPLAAGEESIDNPTASLDQEADAVDSTVNPQSDGGMFASTDGGVMFASGDKELEPSDNVAAGEKRKVKLKARDAVYRYKVCSIGKLRAAIELDSPELSGYLKVGEVIVADQRQLVDNGVAVRINGSRFGVEHAFTNVTTPDGSELLEFMYDDSLAFVFRARAKAVLSKQLEYNESYAAQSKTYAKHNQSGKLRRGEQVEVHSFQTVGGITRLKLHDHRGWTTLVSEEGKQLMEPVRPLDMLRLHLHSLTMQQLREEAVETYKVDPATVHRAGSALRELDPKGALVALCADNWRQSARGTDWLATLLHNADGLFEVFNVGDRGIVQAPGDPTMKPLHGLMGTVMSITTLEAGNALVEFVIDGERTTRMLEATHIKKHVDEAAATSMFDAIERDDKETLDLLIASKTVPSDALYADHTPIPAGHARVAEATNQQGHTLYETAAATRKKRCAEYLATRLMFKAVVDDDLEGLLDLLDGAGSIDAICPHGAFPSDGTISTFDGKQSYPRNPAAGEPLIERARRVWECSGAPDTAQSAQQLGGKCWFVLSERWEDRFGVVYTPQSVDTQGGSLAVGTQSLVTASRMRAKLSQAKSSRATKSQLEATMQWKERNAFMTRKTDIS